MGEGNQHIVNFFYLFYIYKSYGGFVPHTPPNMLLNGRDQLAKNCLTYHFNTFLKSIMDIEFTDLPPLQIKFKLIIINLWYLLMKVSKYLNPLYEFVWSFLNFWVGNYSKKKKKLNLD